MNTKREECQASKKKQVPVFPKHFFWDFDINKVDWEKSACSLITRVLERGKLEHWEMLVDYYGKERVLHIIIHEINYLPDYAIEGVCHHFNLQKEDLRCYIRKQSLPRHWI